MGECIGDVRAAEDLVAWDGGYGGLEADEVGA